MSDCKIRLRPVPVAGEVEELDPDSQHYCPHGWVEVVLNSLNRYEKCRPCGWKSIFNYILQELIPTYCNGPYGNSPPISIVAMILHGGSYGFIEVLLNIHSSVNSSMLWLNRSATKYSLQLTHFQHSYPQFLSSGASQHLPSSKSQVPCLNATDLNTSLQVATV
jgi:hypothetical protein